jgi:hypothetical protein
VAVDAIGGLLVKALAAVPVVISDIAEHGSMTLHSVLADRASQSTVGETTDAFADARRLQLIEADRRDNAACSDADAEYHVTALGKDALTWPPLEWTAPTDHRPDRRGDASVMALLGVAGEFDQFGGAWSSRRGS